MTSTRRATRDSLSTRPMIITIALVTALGGFVLPFVGWLAGIVLMWLSPVWTNATKTAVTVTPFVIGAAAWMLASGDVVPTPVALTIAVIGAVTPGFLLLRASAR